MPYIPTKDIIVQLNEHEHGWLKQGRGILWHTAINTFEEATINSQSGLNFDLFYDQNRKQANRVPIENIAFIKVKTTELNKLREQGIWKY